ncbi:general secretion pathway protein G [Selenomonas ruminantium]|uniref:General secretion pathway protein G n=1 Tax=Selenomonas ruminantium TaxID=971 RepID=A0A1M6WHY7_SELRU|nr:type II secretion system protein [Selenomonas ruminantium]SHK93360.1 general secretion pathway protein G [Selenomonas ruminantium]
MRINGQSGFSLLGMLIAVMIVGVMASMAVPRFASTMITANTAKVQSDLSTLDAAIAVYQLEMGRNPQTVSDLKEYINDADKLKPPHGKCKLSDGTELTVNSTSYILKSVNEEGIALSSMRATCEGHTAGEFGYGSAKNGQSSQP